MEETLRQAIERQRAKTRNNDLAYGMVVLTVPCQRLLAGACRLPYALSDHTLLL